MNFGWQGQSCGSMSRILLHESIHDRVVERILERVRKISQELVLTEWATRCERAYPNCKQAWNGSIGKVRNLTIP